MNSQWQTQGNSSKLLLSGTFLAFLLNNLCGSCDSHPQRYRCHANSNPQLAQTNAEHSKCSQSPIHLHILTREIKTTPPTDSVGKIISLGKPCTGCRFMQSTRSSPLWFLLASTKQVLQELATPPRKNQAYQATRGQSPAQESQALEFYMNIIQFREI